MTVGKTIFRDYKEYASIFLWMIFVMVMSFSNLKFVWILYPSLLILLSYPYRKAIGNWIYHQRYILLYQIIFAGLYFYYHRSDILRLELWSDEIFSLKIAGNSFDQITKIALHLSDIPPLHYWELWFWQKFAITTNPNWTEFIFRIPYMTYHTASAILFAWYISTKNIYFSRSFKVVVNFVCFVSIFFNPLLYPFALEIRPYAAMVFWSIVSIIAIDSGEFLSVRFVPIQLTMFILSFFYAFAYVPILLFSLINTNRKQLYIVLVSLLVVYLTYSPYVRMPNQTIQQEINGDIVKSLGIISSVFAISYMHYFLIGFAIFYSVVKRKSIVLLGQILVLWSFAITLGLLVRYQAFAPRHLIISIPNILYILLTPLYDKKILLSRSWLVIFCICFTIPWMYMTELANKNQAFAPKISIGIKQAILDAKKIDKPIVLETTSLPENNPYYYVQKYFEEISLWYIYRYTGTLPQVFSSTDICNTDTIKTSYLIEYSALSCQDKVQFSSILQFKRLLYP